MSHRLALGEVKGIRERRNNLGKLYGKERFPPLTLR
jgi:hypothetical protein